MRLSAGIRRNGSVLDMTHIIYFDFPKSAGKEWLEFIDRQLAANAAMPIAIRSPMHRHNNFAQFATFVFTSRYLERHGVEKLMKVVIRETGISEKRAAAVAENPFKLGFMLLFGSGTKLITPQELSKWSVHLHYAHLHKVRPEFLIGFIFQEGSYSKIKPNYDRLISRSSPDL